MFAVLLAAFNFESLFELLEEEKRTSKHCKCKRKSLRSVKSFGLTLFAHFHETYVDFLSIFLAAFLIVLLKMSRNPSQNQFVFIPLVAHPCIIATLLCFRMFTGLKLSSKGCKRRYHNCSIIFFLFLRWFLIIFYGAIVLWKKGLASSVLKGMNMMLTGGGEKTF